MSIAILTQVYDEMRRLSIAGSVVASGDFRFKKLVPPLEQSGAKVPVFAKVAEAIKAVVDGNEKTSPQALLELTTLVNAILYTRGETGAAGPLDPIETTDLGAPTAQASARVLIAHAACLLALSGSGIPSFDENLARKLAAVGIPCFGCTPQKLPELLEGALRGADLKALATKVSAPCQ